MSGDLEIIDWNCHNCDYVGPSEKALKDHQSRKRGGRRVGCLVAKRTLGSSSASINSSELEYPEEAVPGTSSAGSMSDLPEDPAPGTSVSGSMSLPSWANDPPSDWDVYFNDTEGSISGQLDTPEVMDDLTTTCKAFKQAMAKTVCGQIVHGPESNSVALPQFGHLFGQAKEIVRKLVGHKDFDSNTDRTKIVENRAARDKVFSTVAVDTNLGDAVIQHGCKHSECSEGCTWGNRRALLHIQQAIFALEVVRSRKAFSAAWVERARGHMRRVKVEANNHYEDNLSKLFRLFGPDLGEKMDALKDETVDTPADVTAPRRPTAAKPPGMEVSVNRLKKGEKRYSRLTDYLI